MIQNGQKPLTKLNIIKIWVSLNIFMLGANEKKKIYS